MAGVHRNPENDVAQVAETSKVVTNNQHSSTSLIGKHESGATNEIQVSANFPEGSDSKFYARSMHSSIRPSFTSLTAIGHPLRLTSRHHPIICYNFEFMLFA
jgi:hypothetical protein